MFTYGDTVRVKAHAPAEMRPGETASVIGIIPTEKRQGSHFDQFPAGTVYLVEFEGGDALDIHESMLEPARKAERLLSTHCGHSWFAPHSGNETQADPTGLIRAGALVRLVG